MSETDSNLWKHSLVPASINAVINGWISWGGFSSQQQVALSLDSIAEGAGSALGNAVMVATSLGLILSLVNVGLLRKSASPRPGAVAMAIRVALRNALFLFGLGVVVSVLWHKLMGTVFVGPVAATAITAAIAFAVSAYVFVTVHEAHRDWLARG